MHLGCAPAADEGAVDQLLQDAGPAAGGVLLLPRGLERRAHDALRAGRVGQALADPGALVHLGREVPANRQRVADEAGGPQVGVDGGGVDEHPGVEQVVGVEGVLDPAEQRDRGRGVHRGEQRRSGAAVTVLARHRPAVRGRDRRRRLDEPAVGVRATRGRQREVDPGVHAAVAEVPVRQRVEPELGEERVEVAQVGAEPRRRHGGVLPAGVGGLGEADAGQPGPVLANLPQRERLGRVGHREPVERVGVGQQPGGARGDLAGVVADDLDEHEPVAAGERRHGGVTAAPPDDVDDAPVEALDGGRAVGQHGQDGVRGVGHAGVAQRDQLLVRGVGDQADRRPGDDGEGALGAREEAGHVEAALGQQVLEAVAGDLTSERAELGPDRAEVAGHHVAQPREAGGQRRCCWSRGSVLEVQALTAPGHHVEGDHVVRRAAVAERARPARVVADHPADRAAVVRRRVRSEPQPVRRGGRLQRGLHDPGLDPGRTRLGVELADPGEVPADVHDQAGADGVPRARGAGAPGGDRHPCGAGRVEDRQQLVGAARPGHRLGDDPVEGGVGGVERAGESGAVERARGTAAVQLGHEVAQRLGDLAGRDEQGSGGGHDRPRS